MLRVLRPLWLDQCQRLLLTSKRQMREHLGSQGEAFESLLRERHTPHTRAKSLCYGRLSTAANLGLLRTCPRSNGELKAVRAPSSISPPMRLIRLPGKRRLNKRASFKH